MSNNEYRIPKAGSTAAVLVALLSVAGCLAPKTSPNYKHWTVSKPVFEPREEGVFENVAVKDPSIVYYAGNYHMFYTGKRKDIGEDGKAKYSITTGYVSAPTLEELNSAKRYDLSRMLDANIIAPQIFYFAPQKLWYIMAHRYNRGNKPTLQPIYLTNPDINNIHGWSKPKDLKTSKRTDGVWIDFWAISDGEKMHLFSMDQIGNVMRMECLIETFPEGLADAQDENTVVELRGENEKGLWVAFEAEHVYYVKDAKKYFMMLEGGYYKDNRKYFADARSRFMIGMTADKLEGPWTRITEDQDDFFAHAIHLYNQDGRKSPLTQVSHPELIRSGYDERCEIGSFDGIQMIFQSFDGSKWADDYNYNELPWKLYTMENR